MLYAAPLIFGLSLGLLSSKTKSICLQHCHFMYFSTSSSSALIPTLTSAHTNTHTHRTVSNSAASGSACVNREQHSPQSETDTNSLSLLFPSIHFSLLLTHSPSQSSPPSSGHYALISSLSPSISVALSYHFGTCPCSCNPFALPSAPAVQQLKFSFLLLSLTLTHSRLYHQHSLQKPVCSFLKHSSPV